MCEICFRWKQIECYTFKDWLCSVLWRYINSLHYYYYYYVSASPACVRGVIRQRRCCCCCCCNCCWRCVSCGRFQFWSWLWEIWHPRCVLQLTHVPLLLLNCSCLSHSDAIVHDVWLLSSMTLYSTQFHWTVSSFFPLFISLAGRKFQHWQTCLDFLLMKKLVQIIWKLFYRRISHNRFRVVA